MRRARGRNGRGYVHGILLIVIVAICFVGFQSATQAKTPGKPAQGFGVDNKIDKTVSFPPAMPMSNKEMTAEEKDRVLESYGKLPLYFTENRGQLDSRVSYYSKLPGHSVYFTRDKIVFELTRRQAAKENGELRIENGEKGKAGDRRPGVNVQDKDSIERLVFTLSLENSKANPFIRGEDKQKGKVNYFTGNNPEKWRTNIPTYKTVAYREVYPGIDMKFYGDHSQLEYDVIVKPGADPSRALFSYEGIEGLRVTEEGELEIALQGGKLFQKKPIIYQDIDGKRVEVKGRFKIQGSTSNLKSKIKNSKFTYGFQVASYNKNHALVIDPVLAYSTYLGGSGFDAGRSIAVDTSGNAYVIGTTTSTDFPIASPIQGTNAGNDDVFVTKIDTSGSSLVYSTFLGGSNIDIGWGVAVDSFGNAYVTGETAHRCQHKKRRKQKNPFKNKQLQVNQNVLTKKKK